MTEARESAAAAPLGSKLSASAKAFVFNSAAPAWTPPSSSAPAVSAPAAAAPARGSALKPSAKAFVPSCASAE